MVMVENSSRQSPAACSKLRVGCVVGLTASSSPIKPKIVAFLAACMHIMHMAIMHMHPMQDTPIDDTARDR